MAVDTVSNFGRSGGMAPMAGSVVPVTEAGGAATEFIGPLYGKLDTLAYTKIDFADTVDFTITNELTGETIWTDTNITTSEAVRPRIITQHTDGAANTTLVIREPYFFHGQRIKIVIAAGGDAKSGRFTALMSQ